MASLEGRWKFVDLYNMEEYLLQIGVSQDYRKNILRNKDTADIISRDGDKWTVKVISKFGERSTTTFDLGKEFEFTTADGRKVNIIYTLDGSKLTAKYRGDYDCAIVREAVDENTMTVTYNSGDATGIRNFSKIPEGEKYGEWPPCIEDLLASTSLSEISWSGTRQQVKDVYDIMTKCKDKYAEDANFLWRFAMFGNAVANNHLSDGNKALNKSILEDCNTIINKAYELDPENASVNKWIATILSALSETMSLKEKIPKSFVIKEHIDKAIKLNPDEPVAYYLRGRWCLEVAKLSWLERKLASTFFAAPPTATVDEGVTDLKRAHDIWPEWKENCFFLAKSLIEQKKDVSTAIPIITRCLPVPVVSADDRMYQPQLEDLLKKHQK